MEDQTTRDPEKTTVINDDAQTRVNSPQAKVPTSPSNPDQADKTVISTHSEKKEAKAPEVQEPTAHSEGAKETRTENIKTPSMEKEKNDGKGISKAGFAAGVAGAGIAGVTLGTVYSEEIKETLENIQNKFSPDADSGANQEAQAQPTDVLATELDPAEVDISQVGFIEEGDVVEGDVVEGVMIDTDGDGSLDYFNIEQVYADGSYIHIEGADGTGIQGFDPLTDTPQGLTYTVSLQDFDSDGTYDDGQMAIVDPEGNNIELDQDSIFGASLEGSEFASMADYSPSDTDLAEAGSYDAIDWQSFSDEPVELGGGFDAAEYSNNSFEEEIYSESDPYAEDLQNLDFDSWETPESYIETF